MSLQRDVRALLASARSALATGQAGLGAVRTALLRPRRFFRSSPYGDSLAIGIGVVLLVAIALTVGILALGVVFDATIDATVTVDNPDRPDDWVCKQLGGDADSRMYEACQEPEQIDRDLGSMLREATSGFLHYGFLGVGLWWLLAAGVVHVGARAAGGGGTIRDSLTVAAWALVPELLRLAVGISAIYYAIENTTIEAASPEAFRDELLVAFAGIETPLLVVSVATIAWQWWILRGGVTERHDVSTLAAGTVAGAFAVITLLIAV
ncbi:Yip1 domain-containing protein [Halopenitus malekzadehii]|uniref:Yip1 domain-containing protein n=1 Tax=Halopenitus malekzadehii TaxID=1267564 RepID=A0A1H6HYU0_9EURY|nr:YIP1 family protein [Halopenitus malekzadehii]SEH39328.1 Yip1 domain-containing protein [Halopenitus malekzadehii]